MAGQSQDRKGTRGARARTAAALSLLCLWAWGFALALPPTGADAWPLLEQAARCLREPGAWWRERYLEGVPIGAQFYRPLFVGSFALQWWAFGATAWPYHVLRLCAYLLLALGAGVLARRRPGAGELAALGAGGLVLLHPLQADVLPSMARSADVLADLLLCAVLICLARERIGTVGLALGALAALAAPGVKEIGLVAPLIGIALLEPWRAASGRARRATSAVLLLGLSLHVALRWMRLGGPGSYETTPQRSAGALENASLLLASLTDRDGAWQWLLPALVFAAALALSARSAEALPPAARDWILTRRGALLWLSLALLGALASPRLAERHAVALLAPLAVLVAPALDARGTRAAARVLATLAFLWLLAPRSPLWRRYGQWDVIAAASEQVIDAAESAVRRSQEQDSTAEARAGVVRVSAERMGGVVHVRIDPFPMQAGPASGARSASLRQPMILMPYSVAAALRLRGLDGPFAVEPVRLQAMLPEHLIGP